MCTSFLSLHYLRLIFSFDQSLHSNHHSRKEERKEMLWPNGLISKKRQSKCAAAVISPVQVLSPPFFSFFLYDKRCSQDSLFLTEQAQCCSPLYDTFKKPRGLQLMCHDDHSGGMLKPLQNKKQQPLFCIIFVCLVDLFVVQQYKI